MDGLGLTFTLAVGAVIALYAFALVRRAKRLSRLELAERREIDGPLADFAAEREARVLRAEFRHATRYGRAS